MCVAATAGPSAGLRFPRHPGLVRAMMVGGRVTPDRSCQNPGAGASLAAGSPSPGVRSSGTVRRGRPSDAHAVWPETSGLVTHHAPGSVFLSVARPVPARDDAAEPLRRKGPLSPAPMGA